MLIMNLILKGALTIVGHVKHEIAAEANHAMPLIFQKRAFYFIS